MGVDDTEIERARDLTEIRETFEQAWASGSRPKIEDYTRNAPADTAAILWQDLMLIELQRLRAAGHRPTEEEYRRRYPQQSHLIQAQWFADSDDAQPHLSVGEKVDEFTLIREIGRGGSGVVWLARDEELQRDVAVKFLMTASSVPGHHGSALYEARVAALLDHRHIVSVFAKGSYRQWDYIVSQYIPGRPLHKWQGAVKPDLVTVTRMCIAIADAVHYAHERGIIHRDLKPGNVIVDREGHPCVTDFGLAKRSDSGLDPTVSGQLMGTHGYMSPEQAMGRSNRADRRSDIYGIGAIMYELLTGTKPFRGDFFEVIQATISKNPVRPRRIDSSIPQALEDICLKCLRKQPRLRYATAAELASDLQSYLDDGLQQAPARQALESVRDRLYVHRRKAVVLAATSVAAVLWSTKPWSSPPSQATDPLRPVRVRVSADPPESQLAIVRIDPASGRFLPESLIHTPNAAAYEVELVPGDYFITARYEDRFHEVYRHVPAQGEPSGFYTIRPWESAIDSRGTYCELREIVVPEQSPADAMVLVSPGQTPTLTPANVSLLQAYGLPKAFLVDPTEFTQGDYKRVSMGKLPSDTQFNDRQADDFPICLRFDEAMRAAEKAGKRLPTESEFEYMATAGYTRTYPWGDTIPDQGPAESAFGPAGTPEFDVVEFSGKPVFGLASNVAEWTVSLPYHGPVIGELSQGEWQDRFACVVRGGSLSVVNGNARVTAQLRNPLMRTFVNGTAWKTGLGFRCVRSAKPHWEIADFQ